MLRQIMERMQYVKYTILTSILFLLFSSPLSAQHLRASMEADTNEIRIGEQLQLKLAIVHPSSIHIRWPQLADTLGPFEVLAKTGIDSMLQGNIIQQSQTITVTSFDSGTYRIPQVPIFYGEGDSADRASYTAAIPITVATVAIDTSQAIMPIKAPMDAPYTVGEIASWVGLALLILAIIGGAYWYWQKRKNRPKAAAPPKPKAKLSPYELASQRLKALETKKLWQGGQVKDYYVELTDIVRQYIEGRFWVPALESTTDEIMDGLKAKDVSDQQKKRLYDLLNLADFVKFAKLKPTVGENMDSLEITRDFINATKAKVMLPEVSEAIKEEAEVQTISKQD